MARISDPDKLSRSGEASTGNPTGNVHFNLTNKTIELLPTTLYSTSPETNELVDAGYNDGGVDLQALYSFIKEQWKSQADLIKYAFPMEAITAEQFEFINGWTLTDGAGLSASKKLIRNGGYAERDTNNVIQKEYAGIISLGTLADDQAQPYYAFSDDTAKIDFSYQGRVNEAILIKDNTVSPIVDDTGKLLTVFVRSAPRDIAGTITGYTFAQTNTTDIGVTTIATQAYRFPLLQAVDPNIDTLAASLTGGVYDNMRIEYYSTPQSITETGTSFNVGVVIDANITDNATQPTVKQIYNWVQNELRSTGDINVSPGDETGTVGLLTDRLVEFVGSTLKTLRQSDNDGVFIEGIGSADFNNVEFIDNTGTSQLFPFKVGVSLTFNENIGNDPNAKYFLFYTTLTDVTTSPNTVKAFGTANTVTVTREGSIDVIGDIHTETPTGLTGSTSSLSPGQGVISAAGNTLTDTSTTAWATDELAGKILRIENGSNAGNYFISGNTGTVVTIETDGKLFDEDDTGVSWSIVNKNTSGTGGTPKVTFTYEYATNTDGGRAAAGDGTNDAAVTLVALGLDSAQYATASGTITRVNSVTLPISNPLERNYEDPQGL